MSTPNSDDISKLHAEINIYLNQRITLLVSAVSIVGIVLAWVTQKANPLDWTTLDVLYLGSSLLLCFLSVIYILDLSLQTSMATCATYLRLSNSSVWEADHLRYMEARYRIRPRRVSSKAIVYGALGLLAAIWPLALSQVVFHANAFSLLGALHVGAAIAFLLGVFVLAPKYLDHRYQQTVRQWSEILSSQAEEDREG